MRLVILKDGTVPIVVLKEVGRDSADESVKREVEGIDSELRESDLHSSIELFEVEDNSTAVYVTWADGWGFEAAGYPTFDEALAALVEDPDHGDIEGGDGHFVVTYGQGEDESYGHIFTL